MNFLSLSLTAPDDSFVGVEKIPFLLPLLILECFPFLILQTKDFTLK